METGKRSRVKRIGVLAPVAVASALALSCATPGGAPAPVAISRGELPATWYAGGPTCIGEPRLRVHAYTEDLYILRQPACTNYEKPFLYLLIGDRRALLLDTGAGGLNVYVTVDSLLNAWRLRHDGAPAELVVAHSHGHGDHVAGDSQFVNHTGVTLVGRDSASVRAYFGVQHWPEDIVPFDLGGRIIDVIPIPGHQPASVAYYDRRTRTMLAGDTFYPGRLYVRVKS